MSSGMLRIGVSGDVYGRWGRRAIWRAVVTPAPPDRLHNADATERLARTIREHLQAHADASHAGARFATAPADDGYRVSGRDGHGAGLDVIVRRSGELTVTPHENGAPVAALVEDFRERAGRGGLEYRAAPWRRHGGWLRFEAAIGLGGEPEVA